MEYEDDQFDIPKLRDIRSQLKGEMSDRFIIRARCKISHSRDQKTLKYATLDTDPGKLIPENVAF